MSGALTEFAANAILDGTPMPTRLYAQGHIADPGVGATGNEADETRRIGFDRVAASSGAAVNQAATLADAVATETWTHLTLWDDPTGGNAWWVIELTVTLDIAAGQTIRFPAGELELAFTLYGA